MSREKSFIFSEFLIHRIKFLNFQGENYLISNKKFPVFQGKNSQMKIHCVLWCSFRFLQSYTFFSGCQKKKNKYYHLVSVSSKSNQCRAPILKLLESWKSDSGFPDLNLNSQHCCHQVLQSKIPILHRFKRRKILQLSRMNSLDVFRYLSLLSKSLKFPLLKVL